MIDKGERFMHITTHHIPAKRRHIDAATRLRRLSHVVAASTRVVRGCKLPPPVNEKKHFELFYNCARIGSFRSASAACYMRAPRPHGCGAWICTRLREHPRGEAPLGLYRICFNSAPTPRRPSARFSPHAELRRPAFSVWAVDSSCPYPSSFGSVCGTSAGVKMGEMAFAELPRVSKWKKCPLRNFRKRQNGRNGLCGTSASIKMEEMALAELPQASKWREWPLRNFRKHQNGRNGPCGTSASVKMEETALAEVPQALLYL